MSSERPPLDPLSWWAERCGVPLDWLRTLPLEARDGAVAFRWPGLEVAKLRSPSTKGWWEPDGSPRPPLWPDLPDEAPPVLVLTEGESDATVALYLLRAAELHERATAAGVTKGAGYTPDLALLWELWQVGVRGLLLVPDLDEAGRRWADSWEQAGARAGLIVRRLNLLALGLIQARLDESDLRDAWRRQPDRLLAAFKAAVEALADGAGLVSTNIQVRRNQTEPGARREFRAADIQTDTIGQKASLNSLPLLGQQGYFVRGFSHLLAAYPKTGKTELMARVVAEWQEEKVLWMTEEALETWRLRLTSLPPVYQHVTLFLALGARRHELLERIAQGDETVVVIDTTKLLAITDPNNEGEVTSALTPFIATCRDNGKTLVLLHHERKYGGTHGEGIAGSHAFLAMVDIGLELLHDDHHPRRRVIRGQGRVVAIPELVYELRDDGTMVALGDPRALALNSVKERVLALLTEDWQTLRDLMVGMGDPRPSDDQVRKALNELVAEAKAERDPPLGAKGNQAHRWRLRQPPEQGVGAGSVSTACIYSRNETATAAPAQSSGVSPSDSAGGTSRPRGEGHLVSYARRLLDEGPPPWSAGSDVQMKSPQGEAMSDESARSRPG